MSTHPSDGGGALLLQQGPGRGRRPAGRPLRRDRAAAQGDADCGQADRDGGAAV